MLVLDLELVIGGYWMLEYSRSRVLFFWSNKEADPISALAPGPPPGPPRVYPGSTPSGFCVYILPS